MLIEMYALKMTSSFLGFTWDESGLNGKRIDKIGMCAAYYDA